MPRLKRVKARAEAEAEAETQHDLTNLEEHGKDTSLPAQCYDWLCTGLFID